MFNLGAMLGNLKEDVLRYLYRKRGFGREPVLWWKHDGNLTAWSIRSESGSGGSDGNRLARNSKASRVPRNAGPSLDWERNRVAGMAAMTEDWSEDPEPLYFGSQSGADGTSKISARALDGAPSRGTLTELRE